MLIPVKVVLLGAIPVSDEPSVPYATPAPPADAPANNIAVGKAIGNVTATVFVEPLPTVDAAAIPH